MTARIHAFPFHVNDSFVRAFSREIEQAGAAGARDFMVDRLGVEWDRLEDLGVECDEIEIRIDALARELWSRAHRNTTNNSPGAA
jgi:hypothetical protein